MATISSFALKFSHFIFALVGPFIVGAVAAISLTHFFVEQKAALALNNEMSIIKVTTPELPPGLNNESIHLALAFYGIKVPESVVGPSFDPKLEDRGLTTGEVFGHERVVRVGPAAFASWALLGSTLAHEIEVHVRQSFFKIVFLDEVSQVRFWGRSKMGSALAQWIPQVVQASEKGGTWSAERDAYLYELKNARRFGLSKEERQGIKTVMNHYYPEPGNTGSVAPRLGLR